MYSLDVAHCSVFYWSCGIRRPARTRQTDRPSDTDSVNVTTLHENYAQLIIIIIIIGLILIGRVTNTCTRIYCQRCTFIQASCSYGGGVV